MSEGLSPQDMVSLGLGETDISLDRLEASVERLEGTVSSLASKYEDSRRELRQLRIVLELIRDGRPHRQAALQLNPAWYELLDEIDELTDEAHRRRNPRVDSDPQRKS